MELLSTGDYPDQLRHLNSEELKKLSEEIRHFILEITPDKSSAADASLGVVELTIALHSVFNTPEDLLIWDIGHQSFVHKILTGRGNAVKNIVQKYESSPFPNRKESPYDVFGTGHACTAISAALGFATARDLKGEKHKVVAIIGDESLTGGMAYEGLNNAGQSRKNLLVVLNDNNASSAQNVGAMANYLNLLITNPFYEKLKSEVWDFTAKLPSLTDKIRDLVRRTQDSIKTFILPGLFFEDLGFRYFGPINGHNMDELLHILGRIKDLPGPILLHVLTKRGKGSLEAGRISSTYPEEISVNKPEKSSKKQPCYYTDIFGKTINQLAQRSETICAVTPAMVEEVGLKEFQQVFPERVFEVGIAEEHAVTFAAGMAAAGNRPILSIHSTFLQRAFDQIIHDVALQRLPVVFAIDRAGLWGEYGPTHQGSFDISYLNLIPDIIISAPKDGQELRNLIYTSLMYDRLPFFIRFPRDKSPDAINFHETFHELPIGKWEIIRKGKELLILAVGSMVSECVEAIRLLDKKSISPTLVNCRYIKPLDKELLIDLVAEHKIIFTVEENSLEGGFGYKISGVIRQHTKNQDFYFRMLGIQDRFMGRGSRQSLLNQCGLSAQAIAKVVTESCAECGQLKTVEDIRKK